MNLDIITKNEAALFSRLEVEAKMTFSGPTPSRKEVQAELAKQEKVDQKLVVVRTINSSYGHEQAYISAFIYKNEEELKKVEPEFARKRHGEKKKEGEEAPAAPAEEEKKE